MLSCAEDQHECKNREGNADFMEKKSLGKRPFRRLTWRCEDNVKNDLTESLPRRRRMRHWKTALERQ
jgi:hypothetical protein